MRSNEGITVFIMKTFLGVVLSLTFVSAQNFQKVHFSIQEERDRWTFIGNVSDAPGFMSSIPLADRDHLLFSFLEQTDYKSMLSIHDESGSLYTTVVIDRESITDCQVPTPCDLTFSIAARSTRKDSPLFKIILVTVTIEDINDNAPTFPKEVQILQISESALNGSSHLIDSAIDEDLGTNSIQQYELVGNRNLFSIAVERKLDNSLSVKLLVIGKLDREVMDFYNCTLYAMDGGQPSRTGSMTLDIKVLDENDNAPRFDQVSYNVSVTENAPFGYVIEHVTANDADIGDNGRLSYRFSPHQSDHEHLRTLFQINETTGELLVIGTLEYKPGKVYQVIIEAMDMGNPQLLSTNQAIVTINVLDTGNNPPVIHINLLSQGSGRVKNISEISGRGTFVAHVDVTDTDTGNNGNVTCRVEDSLFSLETLPAIGFKVVVAGKLDRETQDLHTVIVTCNDFGTPVLSSSASFYVRVTDENDNAPQFSMSNYVEDLYENNDKGDDVLTVFATDFDQGNNSKLEYSIDSSVRDYFTIERLSGTIKARISFDRENRPSYTFKVYAHDFGDTPLTGTATVTIRISDINDNAPKFSNNTFYFSVRENLPSGTVVNRLTAYDPDSGDNGMFTFAISNYTVSKLPFVLFPDGVIKTSMELDREANSSYRFSVIAIDKGRDKLTTSANVVIKVADDNDQSPRIVFPRIDNDTVTIPHMKQSGSYITQIEAYDGDIEENGKLTYVIEEGNSDRLFFMNLNTGVLTMAQMHEVPDGELEQYDLVIAVHDGGVPQRSERCVLKVVIKYSNETMSVAAPVGTGASSNIVIVIVVILLTFCLSVAIIIVICVIRRFDRNRTKGQNIQINKLPNNMTEVRDNSNGAVHSKPYDKMDTLRKKKEVSFSFEDDMDGFRDHEISFSNNSVFMENHAEMPAHHDRQHSQQLKTFQHSHHQQQHPQQQHFQQPPLLGSPARHWAPPGHPLKPLEGKGSEKDNNSDTSRETVTSDSGRGGSDEDFPLHDISKDERDISNVLKCSVPMRDIHHGSTLPMSMGRQNYPPLSPLSNQSGHVNRPMSTDLTDRFSSHSNKQNIDRTLSSLVGGEKPKFTVRKPYRDTSPHSKKPDNWVPSYV